MITYRDDRHEVNLQFDALGQLMIVDVMLPLDGVASPYGGRAFGGRVRLEHDAARVERARLHGLVEGQREEALARGVGEARELEGRRRRDEGCRPELPHALVSITRRGGSYVLSLRSLRFHCPPAAASPTHGAGVLVFAQRLSAPAWVLVPRDIGRAVGGWCSELSVGNDL